MSESILKELDSRFDLTVQALIELVVHLKTSEKTVKIRGNNLVRLCENLYNL